MSTDTPMQMRDIVSTMSRDGLTLRIEIMEGAAALSHIDLDAAQLSLVITALEVAREQMADRIPETLDPKEKQHLSRVIPNPATFVGNEGPLSKRTMLVIRHPGLGWLPFSFKKDDARALAAMLMADVVRVHAQPGIIAPKKPGLIT